MPLVTLEKYGFFNCFMYKSTCSSTQLITMQTFLFKEIEKNRQTLMKFSSILSGSTLFVKVLVNGFPLYTGLVGCPLQ